MEKLNKGTSLSKMKFMQVYDITDWKDEVNEDYSIYEKVFVQKDVHSLHIFRVANLTGRGIYNFEYAMDDDRYEGGMCYLVEWDCPRFGEEMFAWGILESDDLSNEEYEFYDTLEGAIKDIKY